MLYFKHILMSQQRCIVLQCQMATQLLATITGELWSITKWMYLNQKIQKWTEFIILWSHLVNTSSINRNQVSTLVLMLTSKTIHCRFFIKVRNLRFITLCTNRFVTIDAITEKTRIVSEVWGALANENHEIIVIDRPQPIDWLTINQKPNFYKLFYNEKRRVYSI